MEPLSARHVEGSTVYPTIRVASHPGKLLMGVFDATGEYVEDTVLNRRAGEQGAPVPRDLLPAPVLAAEPEAIYAGPLYFHFGHFLLESLARSWYTREHPDLPLVWAGAHTWQDSTLRPWQTEILEILGITQPTRIIADPTRFEKLHVPDIGYRYDDVFHPEHAAFLGRYAGPEQESGARLWLSRNKLSSQWRDLNAGPTEQRLLSAGWTVINPEGLTIRQQLDHLSRAEVVAGEEGSAFHTLLLLRDTAGKRLEILRRHGPEHRNMHTIGDARQLSQRFHSLTNELVLEATGREVSKLNPNSSEILDVLEVPVPPAPSTAPSPTESAVERLLIKLAPDRLLTVSHTHLPDAVRAAPGVAVSTRFDVDPRTFAGDPVDFFELDLAQYAEHFHDAKRPFDVIWIHADDVDEFMRSFDLSKSMAADGAIWVLGTGPQAARCALAVTTVHPGLLVRRTMVGGTALLTVRRELGEPASLADIAAMSDGQVARRLRPLLLPRPRQLRPWLSRRLAPLRQLLPSPVRRLLRRLLRRR